MNLNEIEILAKDLTIIGDPYLDALVKKDPSAKYYPFMYRLLQKINPKLVVELGVCTGHGTAHLAASSPAATIIAVDPNPLDITAILGRYKNIKFKKTISTDLTLLDDIKDESVDLVFVDTLHTYAQVTSEVAVWTSKLKKGGIFLFDDITYSEEMIKFWNELQLPKVSLPQLHWTGFGIAIK